MNSLGPDDINLSMDEAGPLSASLDNAPTLLTSKAQGCKSKSKAVTFLDSSQAPVFIPEAPVDEMPLQDRKTKTVTFAASPAIAFAGAPQPPVSFPEAPFDAMLIGQSLGSMGMRATLTDPALMSIRVRDLEELWKTIKEEMGAYCQSHDLDARFRHVCRQDPCPFDHKGSPFCSSCGAWQPVRPLAPNMHLVVARYVKPWTRRHRLSYAGALIAMKCAGASKGVSKVDMESEMRAQTFISHSWEELFEDFVTTAVNALERDNRVWICSLLIDQNKDIGSTLGTDLREVPFARALRRADRVINFMDSEAITLTRSWVVFETYLAVLSMKKTFHVSLPNNSDRDAWDSVYAKLQDLDVRKCQASVHADHDMIMKFVDGQEDALNTAVKQTIGRACQHASALEAARSGNLAALQSHPEPLCEDAGHTTSLHLAAGNGTTCDPLNFLLEQRADITKENKDGDVALHCAARSGGVDNVLRLLWANADIMSKNNSGVTPLHIAVEEGRSEMAIRLIELGASVDILDAEGRRPLHCSVSTGTAGLAKLLVKRGAVVDATTKSGKTALHLAAKKHGCEDLAAALIELGARVDAKDKDGQTPLHLAACTGCKCVAERLVSMGAAIDVRTILDWTPLHWAAYEGFSQTAERLLALGADVDAKTTSGRTPFVLAASNGAVHTVHLLVKWGAATGIADRSGKMALHWAAENGHTETVCHLIKLGLPTNAVDRDGKTALHFAAGQGHVETATLLLEFGASVNMPEINGRTPILEAAFFGQDETVQVLLDLGADAEDMCKAACVSSSSPTYHRANTLQTEMAARLFRAERQDAFSPACRVM